MSMDEGSNLTSMEVERNLFTADQRYRKADEYRGNRQEKPGRKGRNPEDGRLSCTGLPPCGKEDIFI